MNAIERLRTRLPQPHLGGDPMQQKFVREMHADLAAVDDLYQAAAGFITAADNEMTGWREGEHDEWPEFVALAAAVRRVDGEV